MSAPSAKGLHFAGLEKRGIPWTLLGFIVLSALVHAFGFFLFQTVYPPQAHIAPPPAQVGLLTPGTPEADAILKWINSEDPILAAEPGKAPVPDLMSLPYVPSYATVHARPVMAPAPDEPLPDPAGVSGLTLVQISASHPAPSPPAAAHAATGLSFSGDLEGAALAPLPSLETLHEAEQGDLQPARYLLGVSDEGEARYVFVQESSGDKTLDAAASALLEQVRFRRAAQASDAPGGAPLTWGFATFYWGPSAYVRDTGGTGGAP